MKFLTVYFLLTLFSSCSTFSQKDDFTISVNCSPRAQEQLEKYQSPKLTDEDEERKSIVAIKNITAPIAIKAADECYYNSKNHYAEIYNVCPLISTDKKGKVIFIDVEDNVNKLPTDLQKCLTGVFLKGDYSTLPSKTFGQPLTLTPGKRTY
jgi:hypothetical protein